jgi:hypothetical protein
MIRLSADQRSQLTRFDGDTTLPETVRCRARLILRYADNHPTRDVVRVVGLSTLSVWQEEQQTLLQSFEVVWRHFEGSEFRRNVALEVARL